VGKQIGIMIERYMYTCIKDEPALSSFGNAGVEWVNGKE